MIPLMVTFQTPNSKKQLQPGIDVVENTIQIEFEIFEQHFGSVFEHTPLGQNCESDAMMMERSMMHSNRLQAAW